MTVDELLADAKELRDLIERERATRQRYEAALREIMAEWGRGTAKGQALSMHDIAREALAAAQEGT